MDWTPSAVDDWGCFAICSCCWMIGVSLFDGHPGHSVGIRLEGVKVAIK